MSEIKWEVVIADDLLRDDAISALANLLPFHDENEKPKDQQK